jgi:hypothetical protein
MFVYIFLIAKIPFGFISGSNTSKVLEVIDGSKHSYERKKRPSKPPIFFF